MTTLRLSFGENLAEANKAQRQDGKNLPAPWNHSAFSKPHVGSGVGFEPGNPAGNPTNKPTIDRHAFELDRTEPRQNEPNIPSHQGSGAGIAIKAGAWVSG